MRIILEKSSWLWAVAAVTCFIITGPARAEDRPQLLGISHVAVKTSDIEKSLPFYRDFLGFAEQYRLNNSDGSLKLVCLKLSDEQFIEIFTGLKPDENRLHQVAFRVGDAEATRAYLRQNGVRVPERVGKGSAKNLNFTVKDPAGYSIEFVEYAPDGWTVRDKGRYLSDARVSEHVNHAGIVVADLPATRHFYEDILGMKESWRGSQKGDAISWINVKIPGGADYLEYMLNPKTVPHFCLEAPDIEKAKAKLEQSPYRPKYTKSIEPYVGKNNKRIINLYDPDGTRVELMEPNTVDGKPAPSSDLPLPKP